MSGLLLVAVVTVFLSVVASSVPGPCPVECSCPTVHGANCINSSLNEIPQSEFDQNLTKMNASFNNIVILSKDSLKHIPMLIHLNLSHNKICSIDSQAFLALKNLSSLDLSSNNMTSINSSTFMYNRQLTWLSLAGNSMFKLPSNLFLPQLQYFNLSRCNLRDLQSDTFKSMQELRELYLDNNEIVSLNTGVFRHLYQLQKLDLCYNSIESLREHVFSRLSKLRSLSLCHNNVSRINVTLLDAVVRIGEVVLEGNPFICDCGAADLYYSCAEKKSCHLNLTCEFPAYLKRRQWDVIGQLGCVTTASPTTMGTSSETEMETTVDQTRTEQAGVSENNEQNVWIVTTVGLLVSCFVTGIVIVTFTVKICRHKRKGSTNEVQETDSDGSSSGGLRQQARRRFTTNAGG